MKANILPDKEMRRLGFTDYYNEEYWFFFNKLKSRGNITFNCTIKKKNGYCEIDVLDENNMHPFPYKKYKLIENQVNRHLRWLVDKGILKSKENNDEQNESSDIGIKRFRIGAIKK